MAFETREFYKELDRHYRALDNEKTCEFLQEMADETRGQHASGDERTYGVSGAETPECNYDYVTVCNEYGCFLRNTSKWERSLEIFKEALLELERHQQQDTANYATIRLNMAGTFRQMGNYDKAIELFRESEAFFLNSEDKGKYSYLLASVYNNLSLVYQDKEDYEQAAECGLEALKYLPDHKDVQRATTLNNLAGVCLKQGRLDRAEETVNESIGILKDIDGGMNFHYPAALNTLGSVYYKKGLLFEALDTFLTALDKTEAIYGKNVDYANCCYNISRVYTALGEEGSSIRYFEMAASVRNAL